MWSHVREPLVSYCCFLCFCTFVLYVFAVIRWCRCLVRVFCRILVSRFLVFVWFSVNRFSMNKVAYGNSLAWGRSFSWQRPLTDVLVLLFKSSSCCSSPRHDVQVSDVILTVIVATPCRRWVRRRHVQHNIYRNRENNSNSPTVPARGTTLSTRQHDDDNDMTSRQKWQWPNDDYYSKRILFILRQIAP